MGPIPRTRSRYSAPTKNDAHIPLITPAGRKALVRAERALESVTDEALGALSADERSALLALGDGALAATADSV
jgi:hypothetical protein